MIPNPHGSCEHVLLQITHAPTAAVPASETPVAPSPEPAGLVDRVKRFAEESVKEAFRPFAESLVDLKRQGSEVWEAVKKNLTPDESVYGPGARWEFRYPGDPRLAPYEGVRSLVPGPACRMNPSARACFAVPVPAGAAVAVRPGVEQFVYLDVGFWGQSFGSPRRDFALVCGPEVWLCSHKNGVGARTPARPQPGSAGLWTKRMADVLERLPGAVVRDWVSVPTGHLDSARSDPVFLVLPDTHMWPDPVELAKHRHVFAARKTPPALGHPPGPDRVEAMLADLPRMQNEVDQFAFSKTAGEDLADLLSRLSPLPDPGLRVVQVGDLVEMWAPTAEVFGDNPFDDPGWGGALRLNTSADRLVPLWLGLVARYRFNRRPLHLFRALEAFPEGLIRIAGNHDIFLGMKSDWKDSPAGEFRWAARHEYNYNLLHVEHGHRFDVYNRDGERFGMAACAMANLNPEVRTTILSKVATEDGTLYGWNIPSAALYCLQARDRIRPPEWTPETQPPPFAIFCQGHTHTPNLRLVTATVEAEKPPKRQRP